MKKFYSLFACTSILLFASVFSSAQGVYVTYTGATGAGNWGTAGIWQVSLPAGGGPPNPCNNCTIVINSAVIMNIFNQQITGNSTIIISNTSTPASSLTVQQFMTIQNSSIAISANAALNVNDELHLYATTITLNNTTSVISTLNPSNWVSHGTIDPGDPGGAGLYYNRDGLPAPMGPASGYDLVLNQLGIQGTNPVNGTFIPQYNFNCTASGIPPPQCAPGIVYGPADLEAPTGPSPNDIFQFRGTAPLPVTLVKFDASLGNGNSVNVSWTTAEEINSSYFEVERSADAMSWQPIGQVPAKGQSSGLVDYKFVDPAPTNATNFYRLRMVDLDAKYKFSKVAKVSLESRVAALVVFNNPFHDQIRIK
ncbi:MAG: hypothetical protein ACHQEM_02290, partial [Chitinophagales bacterium]